MAAATEVGWPVQPSISLTTNAYLPLTTLTLVEVPVLMARVWLQEKQQHLL